MPIKIEPWMVSTPIGAAVGYALTKKLLPEKAETFTNLATGTAIGGGLGYAAGEIYEGEKGRISEDPEENRKQLMERYSSGAPVTGDISQKELEMLHAAHPDVFFPWDVPKDAGPSWKRDRIQSMVKRTKEPRTMMLARQLRASYQHKLQQAEASKKNEQAANEYKSQLTGTLPTIGHGWDSAKNVFRAVGRWFD
jgi:hypothetical protein